MPRERGGEPAEVLLPYHEGVGLVRKIALVAALALLTWGGACARKCASREYLDSDLSVVWSVLARDVRSDSDSADER